MPALYINYYGQLYKKKMYRESLIRGVAGGGCEDDIVPERDVVVSGSLIHSHLLEGLPATYTHTQSHIQAHNTAKEILCVYSPARSFYTLQVLLLIEVHSGE